MVQDEVAAEVVLDDGGLAGRGHMTMLRLSWRRDDPLAVALTLTAEPDHPSLPRGEWVVLRDFLRYGLEVPTGDGEVRMRPDASSTGSGGARTAGRAACVSVPARPGPRLPGTDRGRRPHRR